MTSIDLGLTRPLTDVLEDELYNMRLREQETAQEQLDLREAGKVRQVQLQQQQMFSQYADPSVTMMSGDVACEGVLSTAPANLLANPDIRQAPAPQAQAQAQMLQVNPEVLISYANKNSAHMNVSAVDDKLNRGLVDENSYYDDVDYSSMNAKMADWQLDDNDAMLDNNDARLIFDNEFADDDDLSDDENLFDEGLENYHNELVSSNSPIESLDVAEHKESVDDRLRKYHLDNIQSILSKTSTNDKDILQIKLPSDFTTTNLHSTNPSGLIEDPSQLVLGSSKKITEDTHVEEESKNLPDLTELTSATEIEDILLAVDSDDDDLYTKPIAKQTTKKETSKPVEKTVVEKTSSVTKAGSNHSRSTLARPTAHARKLSSSRKQAPKVYNPKTTTKSTHTHSKNNATHEAFVCELVNSVTNEVCGAQFSRTYDLTRHQNTIHAKKRSIFRCSECIRALGDEGFQKTFSRLDALTRHIKAKHENLSLEERQQVTKYAKSNIGFVTA